ncbi:3190_t:CDS:10 [Ambispora leptoticha]|uniref:3190_t:CDS:1 n=1 Tax=Ambispora leptoticha TaxID=144679 RepID=A0A9N8VSI3_9GLOM|nr:3190_t:CDS:10 [Ambispora leptoticha]
MDSPVNLFNFFFIFGIRFPESIFLYFISHLSHNVHKIKYDNNKSFYNDVANKVAFIAARASQPVSTPPTLSQRFLSTFIKAAEETLSSKGLTNLYKFGGWIDEISHGLKYTDKWCVKLDNNSSGCEAYLIAEDAANARLGEDIDLLILYTHGGGFITGHALIPIGAFVYWLNTWKANHNAKVQILSLEYPLSPEHPFPAARDYLLKCYRWLIYEQGLNPQKIVFGGDSAGANLSTVASLQIVNYQQGVHQLPPPASLLLISPLVNTDTGAESFNTNKELDIISLEWMDKCAHAYARGTTMRHESPEISPLFEKDISKMPRFWASVGEYEVFRDDIKAFAKKAKDQGVEVELMYEPANYHNFGVSYWLSNNGAYHRAAKKMGAFLYTLAVVLSLSFVKEVMTIKTSKQIPDFPIHGLLPKEETEAAAFIKKYPEYDGRGTIIAILDSGVDPGAVGLQVTTEGKPKIVDMVDCTGAGDVITKTLVKPTVKESGLETLHVIQGLSGRTLIINPKWSNPSGEFRIGIKRAFELYPTPLVSRLQQEKRQSITIDHHKLQVEVQKQIADWEEAHPPNSSPSESDVQFKTDLEARAEILKDLIKNYDTPGPIFDVVTFFDGSDWRVVVDVKENEPLLTDFRKEHKFHTFSQEDLLNFCLTYCYFSIVTTAINHGTHVAAIAAAYHPDEPALNGVAPGAQIISLKIGDTRLTSMETGAGLARAGIALVNTRADLANMSYGEASATPNAGPFIELIRDEVINKYGCIFLSSAGNNGPALSTTGSPGGTSNGIIGVGAYVSHAMVQAEYALLESVPERSYTWSSLGPTTDGDTGVAPIVGLYCLPTSSPNACGCVALLLSGLKAENKEYTPYRIKNAIINTEKSINDPFGVGLIQVEKAWNFLQNFYDRTEQDLSFEVSIYGSPREKRGIYLRGEQETSTVQIRNVDINPKFMSAIDPTSGENNTRKFEFESRIALISTESWVRAPDFLLFGSQGRGFQIKVDPTQLARGKFYYAEVQGYDTSSPFPAPIFKVPITITKPLILNGTKYSLDSLSFGPGHIERNFVKVPDGATFADVVLRFSATQNTDPAHFLLHMIQLLPQSRYTKQEREYHFMLGKGSYGDSNGDEQIEKKRFAVVGGVTLEVCLAQFWSSLGNHTISLEIAFHGIQLTNNTGNGGENIVYINGGDAFTRLDIIAPPLRPTEYSLRPLSPQRDVLPNSRQIYGLQLTYTFKTTENNLTVTPRFTAFFDYLYDSYFQDFFAIVYDANKKVLGYIDIYPKNFKLDVKGDYTIRAQIRNDSQDLLEKLTNTVCQLDITLSKKVNLEIHSQVFDVFASKRASGRGALEKGERKALFVASPHEHNVFPKDAKYGDLLIGNLNFVNSVRVDGGQYKVMFIVPPAPVKTKEPTPSGENGSNKGKDGEKEKSKEETVSTQLTESIRDTQIAHIRKFPADSTSRKELIAELEDKYPTHLPLYQTKLELLLEGVNGTMKSETAKAVIEVADQILANIDFTELSSYYGVKQELNNEAAKKKKKEFDDKKKIAILALRSKAQGLAILIDKSKSSFDSSSSGVNAEELTAQFEKTYQTAAQWLDTTSDLKNLLLYVMHERRAGRYGNAIKAINKYVSEQGLTKENAKEIDKAIGVRLELLRELNWDIWSAYEEKWKLIRVPPGGYAPF